MFIYPRYSKWNDVDTNGSQDVIAVTFYEPFGRIISGGSLSYDYEGIMIQNFLKIYIELNIKKHNT